MAAAGYLQENGLDDPNSKQALNVAYSDVKRAFEYFLEHYHSGEPIIIAGHSQGALLSQKLISDLFKDKPLDEYLAAAYLVGTTVFDVEFKGSSVGICQHKDDVKCVMSWRTFGHGGDTKAFLHFEPPTPQARPICTNPLSWINDGAHQPKSKNLGGLQLMHYNTM